MCDVHTSLNFLRSYTLIVANTIDNALRTDTMAAMLQPTFSISCSKTFLDSGLSEICRYKIRGHNCFE